MTDFRKIVEQLEKVQEMHSLDVLSKLNKTPENSKEQITSNLENEAKEFLKDKEKFNWTRTDENIAIVMAEFASKKMNEEK